MRLAITINAMTRAKHPRQAAAMVTKKEEHRRPSPSTAMKRPLRRKKQAKERAKEKGKEKVFRMRFPREKARAKRGTGMDGHTAVDAGASITTITASTTSTTRTTIGIIAIMDTPRREVCHSVAVSSGCCNALGSCDRTRHAGREVIRGVMMRGPCGA